MNAKEPWPRVSLLMPNRNNARILDHVLDRLATSTTDPNVELVIVDDGSTDTSREIVQRWASSGRLPELRLIEREHRGVVDALNVGLAQASGELIVQLDADASLESAGWLERMVSFFESDPTVGVVTGKVVFDWGELHTCGIDVITPDGFHDRGTVITEPIGRRTYHQRVIRFREGRRPDCETIAEVDGGIGCCMMYRRQTALELGGYDPGYSPVWFDDLDLTIGIRRLGFKVFYLPDVRVIHHVGNRMAGDPTLRRALRKLRRGAGAALPTSVRHRVMQRLNIDLPPGQQWERLQHHYDYWRAKWGWDMLNPDVDEIFRRWGTTELCWRFNPKMKDAGRQIIEAFERSD